jgi:hypothetical protein
MARISSSSSSLLYSLFLIVISLVSLISISSSVVEAIRFEARLVGGAEYRDIDGSLIKYFIFAEERAAVSPTPEFVIYDYVTKSNVALGPTPLLNQRSGYKNPNRTRTISDSRTIGPLQFSELHWYVRSAPFGALGIEGPRSWTSTGYPDNKFRLTNWKFLTAGDYNIQFNTTFMDGTHFVFNHTLRVNRQPAFLTNGALPFGYNGSAWSPAPVGYVQNILGVTIATASVRVVFEFQAFPDGATWTGTFSRFTSSAGAATFDDIVVSIPGTYTYRMIATLSDGTNKTASSVQIQVERALPTKITRLASMDSMARFVTFELPQFIIYDRLGLSYDTRLNMTLSLTSNLPFYSYSGFDTVASLVGVISVQQRQLGYAFEFPGVSFDLPGAYEVTAAIALPDSTTLSLPFIANIDPAPTFQFTSPKTLRQNKISEMIIFGKRPPFNEILLMLARDGNCSQQASDMISWSAENANTTAAGNRTFSVVPWYAGTLYPCMKLPSQSYFGGLVQYYLQQFDEQYPFITSVTVAGVDECLAISSSESLQYRAAGWDDIEVNRQYGCALPTPASGTIAPCSCPSHLTCGEYSHSIFTPSGLNIGTCQCCSQWIMAVASTVISAAFLGMLYVVYEYV